MTHSFQPPEYKGWAAIFQNPIEGQSVQFVVIAPSLDALELVCVSINQMLDAKKCHFVQIQPANEEGK